MAVAAAGALLLAMSSPASAQTGKEYAEDTVVATDGTIHPLASVEIEADAGDEFYVVARLQTKSATQSRTHRMLVALLLGCSNGAVDLRSTQNIDYGQDVLAHQARYIFEAPQDGVYECKLQSRGWSMARSRIRRRASPSTAPARTSRCRASSRRGCGTPTRKASG
jgi:hypothetical protein